MNIVKKYFKQILCFLAFILASIIFAFSPISGAYAAEIAFNNYVTAINAIKMPSDEISVADGETLDIPLLATTLNGAGSNDLITNGYTIQVVDTVGTVHEFASSSAVSDFDDGYFAYTQGEDFVRVKVLDNGKYDIMYVVTSGDKTYYSANYSVTVSNARYEFDFTDATTGLETLVPTRVAKDDEARIEIPVARVKQSGIEEDIYVDGVTVLPRVTVNDVEQDIEDSEYISKDDSTGKYYVIPSVSGTITLQYDYNLGSVPPSETYTIEVSDTYEMPTSEDIDIAIPSLPSIELGEEDIELPSLTVNNNHETNVDYNITKIVITKVNNTSITATLPANTLKFDMTVETFNTNNPDLTYREMVGDYRIEYFITDAYGNEATVNGVVRNVTDSSNPTVYLAYEYNVTGEGANIAPVDTVNTEYAVDMKAKYGYSELLFPAIFAEDLVSNYGDFKFYRYIQNNNTRQYYYLDNVRYEDGEFITVNEGESGYNYAKTDEMTANSMVRFQFTEEGSEESESEYAGTYTLYYRVYSDTIKSQNATISYTFEILPTSNVGDSEKSTPTISINNLRNGSSVASTDEIEVNITASDTIDERLKKAVFYYYGTTTASDTLIADINEAINSFTDDNTMNVLDYQTFITKMQEKYTEFNVATVDEDDENTFYINLEGYTDQENVQVLAVALNDFENIAVATRTLNIKNMNDDVAPTYTIMASGSLGDGTTNINDDLTFDQDATITLPTVAFADTEDEYLATSVYYYIGSPESEGNGLQFITPSDKNIGNTVVGGTIVPTESGTYYVVYTAIDDAGNTSYVFFTFDVEFAYAPVLEVNVSGQNINSEQEVELVGNSVEAEEGATITFEPTVYTNDRKTDISDTATIADPVIVDNGIDYRPTGNGQYSYQFLSTGTFDITFKATDTNGKSDEQTIHVTIVEQELAWDNVDEASVATYANLNETVRLPLLTATRGANKADVTVKVTDPNGNEIEVEQFTDETSSGYRFTTSATTKGEYTVTYTASLKGSESISQEYNIQVGDSVKPDITLDSNAESVLKQDLIYDGTNAIEYQITMDRYGTDRHLTIKVTNNGTVVYEQNTGLNITDRDGTGQSTPITSWGDLEVTLTSDDGIVSSGDEDGVYLINGAGRCVLTISITDRYDNEREYTVAFNVVTESDVNEETDDYVGVILIVVSLLILAGVILFFTFAGKKGGSNQTKASKKTTKSAKTSKKSSEETEEVVEKSENSTSDDVKTGEVE